MFTLLEDGMTLRYYNIQHQAWLFLVNTVSVL